MCKLRFLPCRTRFPVTSVQYAYLFKYRHHIKLFYILLIGLLFANYIIFTETLDCFLRGTIIYMKNISEKAAPSVSVQYLRGAIELLGESSKILTLYLNSVFSVNIIQNCTLLASSRGFHFNYFGIVFVENIISNGSIDNEENRKSKPIKCKDLNINYKASLHQYRKSNYKYFM